MLESYSFLERRIIQNILLVSLLFSPGCSKEEEPPTNGTPHTQVSKSIGSSGGSIEIDSFSITIPPGAFRNDQILEVSISDKQHPFLDQEVTDLYSVKGIPEEFLEPIIIRLKYEGILKEESYLAFGKEQALEESDTGLISFDLLDCVDSSGFLVGNLWPPGQKNGIKAGQGSMKGVSSDIPDDLTAFIKGVTDFTSYKSDKSIFTIKCPASLVLNPRFLSLSEYLDLNYLNSLTLYGQVFKGYQIPVRVNVFDNRNASNSNRSKPYFEFIKIDNDAYPGDINNESFSYTLYKEPVDEAELSIKIGTTFYETFQSYAFYDNGISTPDQFSNASRLWIEEKFIEPFGSTENYVPKELAGNELTVFGNWDNRTYRGLVPLVKYLDENYGEEVIFHYHYHIWQHKSQAEALKLSIGKTLEEWFPEFLQDYLEGKVYGVKGNLFETGIKANYDLPPLNSPQPYPEKYIDMAAKMFRFSTKGIANATTGVEFTVLSEELASDQLDVLVFSIHRTDKEIKFIADNISNHEEVYGIADLDKENKDLLVVVVNSELGDRPYNESTITLNVELKESMLLSIKKFGAQLVHFAGDVHYGDGTIKTFDNIQFKMYMPDAIDGKFTGNKFEAKWDEPWDVYTKDSGHVVAIVMKMEGQLKLIGFDFYQVLKNNDGNYRYSFRLMGGGIDLFQVEGTGYLTGLVEGIDIDNKLSVIGWKVEPYNEDQSPKPQSYKVKNIRFKPESYLRVSFSK